MSHARRPHLLAGAERLEQRENPAAWYAEGFDQLTAPTLPSGWAGWANDGQQQFITSKLSAASGPNSLASLGSSAVESRLWNASAYPGDFGGAVSVRSDTAASLELIARGRNLNTATPTYLAAVARTGGTFQLVQEVNGQRTLLGSVRPAQALVGVWLRVSLQPVGTTVTVQVQRADTGQYLTAAGQWQSAATDAMRATTTIPSADGLIGVGRDTGGSGMAFLDDFAALAPPGLSESFDATPVGRVPDNWQKWTSDNSIGPRVNTARSLSPSASLAMDGGSITRSRAWLGSAVPADASASVSVLADGLIPAGVLLRGANLNTATPTYYSLVVSRGLNVQLKRVVNGVETTLGSLRTADYLSGPWVKLTLSAVGDTLRAIVYRTDTRQWLGADGRWADTPDVALEATDTAIRTGGFAGAERTRITAGAVYLDDFQVRRAGASAAPQLDLTASQSGNTFRDVVRFTATGTPADAVARIEFKLDGRVRSVQSVSPARWDLDTTTLADGPHQLVVRVVDWDGNTTTRTLNFSTSNGNVGGDSDRPTGVRKYSHIRLAQLAYSGNPMGQFERDLARNSLDLIVAHPSYLSTLEAATADTPKVIYTNVSNLYGSLLTDWLAYADRTGADRESAFFHVTQATAFSGASASSTPVNQFWGVYTGSAAGGALTDRTGEARGTRPAGVEFGTTGQAVNIGWTDRFREINVVLNRAGANWQGRFEYVSAVNADGTPKTWSTLTLLADGTAAFTRNGQLTFDPPADWKAAKLPGTAHSLYYVRAVTTAGTGPNAKTLLGRDYVNAGGRAAGTIPAFDYAADRNGDGYLSDAEYAARRAGYDARFVHEARLFYPYYGQMRFVTNPGGVAFRQWAGDYHRRLSAANPLADGFFVDNSNGRLPFAGTPVRESVATFTQDSADAIAAVTRAVPGKWVIANTAGGRDEGNPIAAAATGTFEEFVLRPNDVNWSGLADAAALIRGRLNSDSPSPYVTLDSHSGTGSTTSERTRTGTLAYYYLLADPDKTFLSFFGGQAPAAAWNQLFIPAAAVNVGRPTGAMTTFATGTDPQNATLTYKVFARDYGNAKVLFKPRSYALGRGTGTTDDATATAHNLGGNYRVLKSDGTLGPVVTSITLRNGEGAVLMKA